MENPLFVWREIEVERYLASSSPEQLRSGIGTVNENVLNEILKYGIQSDVNCKYCGLKMLYYNSHPIQQYCSFCGYHYGDGHWGGNNYPVYFKREAVIRVFDINSPNLSFEELAAYLHKDSKRLQELSPRKFEEMVGDIFRNQGYHVELTQATRDGGYDLLLLSNGSTEVIVEAKRYKENVGVGLVRNLAGVQLINGFKEAILVSASSFTPQARREANSTTMIQSGYKMVLQDAEVLLRALGAYKNDFTLIEAIEIKRKIADLD